MYGNDKYQATAEQEQKGRAFAMDCGAAIGGQFNCATTGPGEPARDGLIDRVRRLAHRAQMESVKASRLDELDFLLSKNPDIARILELMELIEDVKR